MNCPAASIRTIGDFACGDQLIHLDRSRTESPARSCFCDAEHRDTKIVFNKNNLIF